MLLRINTASSNITNPQTKTRHPEETDSQIQPFIVKCDENSPTLPGTFYIESIEPVLPHIYKFYIGPRVQRPKQWVYIETVDNQKGDKRLKLLRS